MSTTWFLLILLCLLMYVVLDGYDLGIGIATLLERDARHRHEMLEQVAQAWDGNETWLVLLGVSLWAGFPVAFGTLLPHAYLPVVVMLFALIVRGVSVEMASQAGHAPRWERAFGVASLTAALAQGAAAGTLTANLTVDRIGWFSALSAATVTAGYLAIGYAYTKWKATGELRARAGRRGTVSTVLAAALTVACLVAVNGTAAPLNLRDPARAALVAGLLLLASAGLAVTLVTLRPASRNDAGPIAGLAATVAALVGALVAARYPMLAPPGLTLAGVTAPDNTMVFLAVGIGLNVPLILYYNWFAHHAFHGKATGADGRQP
jgi:cytochrome d ubiquinol oxidase subunit II